MIEQTLSPSVRAALASNEKLARDTAKIPGPQTEEARDIVAEVFGPDALFKPSAIPEPPPPEPLYRELFEKAPESIDAVLIRVDAIEERAARYRRATGHSKRRLAEIGISLGCKVEPTMIRELDRVAKIRGETRSTTARFLLACGLALFDERCKRYEAYIQQQIALKVMERTQAGEKIADVIEDIQPERFIEIPDPFTPPPVLPKAVPTGWY